MKTSLRVYRLHGPRWPRWWIISEGRPRLQSSFTAHYTWVPFVLGMKLCFIFYYLTSGDRHISHLVSSSGYWTDINAAVTNWKWNIRCYAYKLWFSLWLWRYLDYCPVQFLGCVVLMDRGITKVEPELHLCQVPQEGYPKGGGNQMSQQIVQQNIAGSFFLHPEDQLQLQFLSNANKHRCKQGNENSSTITSIWAISY